MSKKRINIHLLVNYFNTDHINRQSEIDYCLYTNIYLPEVKVHLLVGNDTKIPMWATNTIIKRYDFERLTYQQFFDYANTLPKGSIAVIVNADIACCKSIRLLEEYVNNKTCVCLGRHNMRKDGQWKRTIKNDTQDLWAIKTPIPKLKGLDFYLGVPGCDNHIAYVLSKKYKLRNPCKRIIIKHYHSGKWRDRLPRGRIKGKIRRINIE